MEKKYDVITVGLMAYDMILRTVDEGILNRDATLLQDLGISAGGGAMTQAVIANRLGCKTAVMARVGGDSFGDFLVETLKKEGVDCTYIRRADEQRTMVTIALVKADSTRNFLTREGENNSKFCVDDIDFEILGDTKIVSYGSFYFLPGLDGNGEEKIFQRAKESGAITVADTASDAFAKGPELVFKNLPDIDYFIPSYEEAEYLTKEASPLRMAEALLAKGAGHIIIKLGGEGCYVAYGKTRVQIPAIFQKTVCDTTGAGDNFVGAFLSALKEGMCAVDAAKFANAAASISVTGIGAVTKIYGKEEILQLL